MQVATACFEQFVFVVSFFIFLFSWGVGNFCEAVVFSFKEKKSTLSVFILGCEEKVESISLCGSYSSLTHNH